MPEASVCRLLSTTRDLEEFSQTWNALWAVDPNATPFQRPEWLLPWWRQFGQPDLRAIVILQSGKPIGFLPLYIYFDETRDERQLLLIGAGTSDYLDGVFAPECTPTHLRAALDLVHETGGWDIFYACQLRRSSILFRALQQAADFDAHPFNGMPCSRLPALRIPDLPPKIRRNAMYYRNRATRLGALELMEAAEPLSCFDDLIRLHSTRWQNQGVPGIFADPRVIAWHREVIPKVHRAGLLRLSSLCLNGETLALAYTLLDPSARLERTEYVYLMAHSVEHADLRPGTLLLAHLLERAAEEGIDTVDLLRGEEHYKKIWHAEHVATYGFAIRSLAGAERALAA